MPEFNDWSVPYSSITFFGRALDSHSRVASHQRSRDIVFTIRLVNGRTVTAVLLEEYVLGLAAVLRAKAEFPEAEHVISGGMWTAYTPEAKEWGLESGIGVFTIPEFLGALHRREIVKYCRTDDDGHPVYSYKHP